jgi:glucosamine-6-phosphate deaminase
MEVRVVDDAVAGGRLIADLLKQTLSRKPDSLLGLASGGTVIELYRFLCEDYRAGLVDFSKAYCVNLDEYAGLPGSHNQSFAWFLNEYFFSKTNFEPKNIHLFNGAGSTESELAAMNSFLSNNTIDFQILGVGENGHIGFNEPEPVFISSPHMVKLTENTIAANARFFEKSDDVPRNGLTMGMRDIVKAKQVVLAAYGEKKAQVVDKLLNDDFADPMLPCSVLKLCANALIIVDRTLADLIGLR